jgi:hypothetical protein
MAIPLLQHFSTLHVVLDTLPVTAQKVVLPQISAGMAFLFTHWIFISRVP